jgi:hypothetical protein
MQVSSDRIIKLPIRSVYGNLLLLVVGAGVAVASAVLLVMSVVMLSGMGGLINKALQLFFLGALITGAAIGILAAANVRGIRRSRFPHHSSPRG